MFYDEENALCRSRHQERKDDFREVNRRYEQFKKNLRKQYRHLADEPSCRLGKNAKKKAARLNFILKTEDAENDNIEENEINEKTWNNLVPDYMIRVVSKRIKRKVGHRVTGNYHEE